MNRRELLTLFGALSGAAAAQAVSSAPMQTQMQTAAQSAPPVLPGPHKRSIPSSGESIPVIGMGTWLSLDVGNDKIARAALRNVLQEFFNRGGTLIDSSPMYGSAEDVLGDLLPQVVSTGREATPLFAASKVWTLGEWMGTRQMETSQKLWKVPRFDLMQIHNMLDWESHLKTLKAWKADGRIRYIGITTSHGRRHEAMEAALKREAFDFVQFTYNLADRDVEKRLLPAAAARRIAVIVNRPFDGGALFSRVRGNPLPAWAGEIDCRNWAQYFLKFVVSHPAVTCVIPATSKAAHMAENMGALYGRMPDAALRARMAAHFDTL